MKKKRYSPAAVAKMGGGFSSRAGHRLYDYWIAYQLIMNEADVIPNSFRMDVFTVQFEGESLNATDYLIPLYVWGYCVIMHSVKTDIYMSNLNRALKRWEEHVISHEKGNRIVQYRIVDNNRNSILAVVGRERGHRHMTYTVTGDLFCVFGPVSKVPAGTKWTSRKPVVDFLSSLTSSSGPILANLNQRRIGLATHPKKEWLARFDSESDKWTSEEELAAEGICSLRQSKKARFEGEIVLWAPQISSESEESRYGAWLPPGLSASGDKRPSSSSATVDSKQRRRIAGVEPNGPSAASGVPLKAGMQRVPKSKDRRA